MFGDSVGLYMGSLEFLQTDASLVGSNELEVAIKRKLRMGESPSNSFQRMSGGFSLAIPHMHGVFSQARGWSTSKGEDPSKRCTNYWWPAGENVDGTGYNYPTTPKKFFYAEEFWFGVSLYMPGAGDEAVLRADTYAGESVGWPRPSNGSAYPLRTKTGSAIRCVPMQNGAGEGFEVLTQDGTSYRLDHMAVRSMVPLLKTETISNSNGQFRLQWVMNRAEYFLAVTSVRDRFGNTVTYEWDQSDPWKLNRIYSSDGRVLEITSSNNIITQVRAGDRTWTYEGSRVINPDQSFWEFTSMDMAAMSYNEGSIPGKNSHCLVPGYPTTKNMRAVMRHPSGAIATFEGVPTLHGRSRTVNACDMSYQPNTSAWLQSSELYPASYYLWSISSKSISGPGLPAPLTWTYKFSPPNGCYAPTDPSGRNTCNASSPITKWVDVTAPDNLVTRYTFGNQYNVDEGFLLRISGPNQVVVQDYGPVGTVSYPLIAGIDVAPPRSMQAFSARILPLRTRTVTQDGTKFEWAVKEFDSMSRPKTVTKSSYPGE
jgi:hypothetical protein